NASVPVSSTYSLHSLMPEQSDSQEAVPEQFQSTHPVLSPEDSKRNPSPQIRNAWIHHNRRILPIPLSEGYGMPDSNYVKGNFSPVLRKASQLHPVRQRSASMRM